ncbi:DnaD domain protein [Lederbergia ruris]|uniref:DnaD domain protein n=1 Tax=Lederbergia ruris TaxID=217495 RepID=UPI0039A0AA28
MTKREKLIEYFKTVTPEEFLMDLQKGSKPIEADLKLIKEIREIGLSNEAINVLIHYILIKSDMKLNKNYALKIASHWNEKRVTTADEAMKLAKQEHEIYGNYKNSYKESSAERLKAIEVAAKDLSMTNEQLGQFVRSTLKSG